MRPLLAVGPGVQDRMSLARASGADVLATLHSGPQRGQPGPHLRRATVDLRRPARLVGRGLLPPNGPVTRDPLHQAVTVTFGAAHGVAVTGERRHGRRLRARQPGSDELDD